MSEYEVPLDEIDKESYDEPYQSRHVRHEDDEMGKIVGWLTPEEVVVFTRMRSEQSKTHGGIGITEQRRQSMPLIEKTMNAAKAEVAAHGGA